MSFWKLCSKHGISCKQIVGRVMETWAAVATALKPMGGLRVSININSVSNSE